MSQGQPRELWGTRIGVILAVAGSAVGLGNFLRFPGQAAQNGGGAFMIPYFIALLLVAIPICWAEWAMGRFGGRQGYNSAPAIFGILGGKPTYRYVGVLGVMIPMMIYMYYVLIEAWCLGYAWAYLSGSFDLGADPSGFAERSSDFYRTFIGGGDDGALFTSGLQPLVYFALLTFVLNFFLIYRGVSRGIEAFCIRAMPVMAVCALIVLVRVLTLGTPNADLPDQNVTGGLGFMWNPQGTDGSSWVRSLLNPQTWMAATGQIFFSMSVGFGIIINYASYLRRNDDVVLSGLTAASTNEFFEVCLGGLITLPAAFIFLGAAYLQDPSKIGTFSLGFETLPVVFEYMPGGRWFGFVWFFMLFLAAITSSLSMLQPAIAFLEEGLGIGRRASVTLLGLITLFGAGFILWFSKESAALNTMDFWVGTAFIFVLAMLEVMLFSWVFGVERGYDEAMRGAELRIPRVWKWVIKYISPTYLLAIFIAWCWQNLPAQIETVRTENVPFLSVLVILAVAIFVTIMVNIASKRWNNHKLAIEGVASMEAAS